METLPEVLLLLDAEGNVMQTDCELATAALEPLGSRAHQAGGTVHAFLHLGCESCNVSVAWQVLWEEFQRTRLVEIELKDFVLGAQLRLGLRKSVLLTGHEAVGAQRGSICSIKDISQCRSEHQKGDAALRILAEESERWRIAEDLHDGLCQTLGAIKYRTETVIAAFPCVVPRLDAIVEDLRRAIEDVHRVAKNLAPASLDGLGLVAALRSVFDDFQAMYPRLALIAMLDCADTEVPRLLRVAIYRIVQEALTNVGRHSGAHEVSVLLRCGPSVGLLLCIEDDGAGFPLDESVQDGGGDVTYGKQGLGLSSMRQRVESTGGELTIDTRPGGGACVCATWPPALLR